MFIKKELVNYFFDKQNKKRNMSKIYESSLRVIESNERYYGRETKEQTITVLKNAMDFIFKNYTEKRFTFQETRFQKYAFSLPPQIAKINTDDIYIPSTFSYIARADPCALNQIEDYDCIHCIDVAKIVNMADFEINYRVIVYKSSLKCIIEEFNKPKEWQQMELF